MAYSENLIVNGETIDLTGWTAQGVTIVTSDIMEDQVYRLANMATMTQTIMGDSLIDVAKLYMAIDSAPETPLEYSWGWAQVEFHIHGTATHIKVYIPVSLYIGGVTVHEVVEGWDPTEEIVSVTFTVMARQEAIHIRNIKLCVTDDPNDSAPIVDEDNRVPDPVVPGGGHGGSTEFIASRVTKIKFNEGSFEVTIEGGYTTRWTYIIEGGQLVGIRDDAFHTIIIE